MERGEQRPRRGRGRPALQILPRTQIVRPQLHAVLGDEQGHAREVPRQQPGQGRRAAGGGVAQVDRAEPVVLVPVEGQRSQRALHLGGDGEQIRYACAACGTKCAGRAAGALQGAHRGLGAQGADQSALVPGEFRERVQRAAETVRHSRGGAPGRSSALSSPSGSGCRRRPGRPFERGGPDGRVPGAHGRRQLLVALGEPPPRPSPVSDTVVLGGPQRCGAYAADLGRELDPALVLLLLAAAERVDVELVLPEPAHEPVAPEPGVTAHIRIATLRKQSDAHERTPDLPYGEPPLTRRLAAGRTYADMTVARWTVVHRATKRGERS